MMNGKDRLEARPAPSLLPLGAILTLVSVVAFLAVLLLAFATFTKHAEARTILLVWCIAALIVAAINIRKSIEVMSATDWRAAYPIAALSVAITLAYPGWWL